MKINIPSTPQIVQWQFILMLVLVCVGSWIICRPLAVGVLCWYITGIDDLNIFTANYIQASKQGHGWKSIAGVLLAVACMIAIVAVGGNIVSNALWEARQIAIFIPLVPFSYGLGIIEDMITNTTVRKFYRAFGNICLLGVCIWMLVIGQSLSSNNILAYSWLVPSCFFISRVSSIHLPVYTGKTAFTRSFLGFALNCTDDIALNLTIAATIYVGIWDFSLYMIGIALGSLSMVTIAHRIMRNHLEALDKSPSSRMLPILQIFGYWGASVVILVTMQFDNIPLIQWLAGTH